jgi:hypothetical protein
VLGHGIAAARFGALTEWLTELDTQQDSAAATDSPVA